MGVHGLWKLIEPVGKPIPVESLENKVLAVDVSIWLYQLTKGIQTTGGGAVANAHILGLFNRICKLLYYRIKPIFVFDGGAPALKRETIELRKLQKRKAADSTERLHEKLLQNLLKQNAVSEVLGQAAASSSSLPKEEDLFALPPIPEEKNDEEDEDEDDPGDLSGEDDTETTTAKVESLCDYIYGKDVHSIDINSEQFRSLPPSIRHEILSELIETRKQSSWGRFQEMKKDSNFSDYQMKRLVKRRNVQRSLDDAAKEMGGRAMTLGELEDMFREDGIVTDSLPGQRIAKDNVTKFIYVMGDKSSDKKIAGESSTSTETNPEPINDRPSAKVNVSKDLDEEEFRNQCFEIDENLFTKDLSSDEDDLIMEENNVDNYAEQLSREERLSQEEILRIIKSRQSTIPDTTKKAAPTDVRNSAGVISSPLAVFPSTSTASRNDDFQTSPEGSNNSPGSFQEPSRSDVIEHSLVRTFTSPSDDFENASPDIIEDSQELSSVSLSKILENQSTLESRSRKISPSDKKGIEIIEVSDETGSDDDFLEVNSNPDDDRSGAMEIVIDTSKCVVDDDIFADVFQADSESRQDVSENNTCAPCTSSKNEEIILEKPESRESDSSRNSTPVKKIPNIFHRTPTPSPNKQNSPAKRKIQLQPTVTPNKQNSPAKQRIQSGTQQSPSLKPSQADVDLLNAQRKLYEEELELQSEYGKQERLGSTITQQMIVEAQELLRLFGLPYVVAPMEAEAQCAFLDRASLTDGTITDDSDIWLFGGQNVYKNFFDNNKFVLQFRDVDIEHFFRLSRAQLIQMALLVGSDYTVGIEGVGPVTALEILAYFSNKANAPETEADIADTLRKFKSWIEKNRNNASSVLSRKVKNMRLTEEFPSMHVIEAYLYPTVDESKETFTWAAPDLDRIRQYMKAKFAWKMSRIDDLLLPVMKRINQRQKQTTLDAFFKVKPHTSIDRTTVSERVIQAISIMKNKVDVDVSALPTKSPRKKKAAKKTNTKSTPTKNPSAAKKTNTKSTPTKNQRPAPKTGAAKSLLKAFSPSKPSTSAAVPEKIPQREKSRLEAVKRRMEAAKVMRKGRKKRRGVLEPKVDSSYLSNSSSDSS